MLKLHIAKPLQLLNGMLAESEHVQTLLGIDHESDTANADAAAKISYGYAEDDQYENISGAKATKVLPRVLTALEDCDSDKETDSSWRTTVRMSVLIQTLRLQADSTKDLSGRYKSFLDRIEGVVDDLRELAGDNTRLNLRSFSLGIPPQRADIKETNGTEIWWTVLIVEAGG
jgi:hypothetical protein